MFTLDDEKFFFINRTLLICYMSFVWHIWQKRDSVKKLKSGASLKTAGSLKIEKKFKDLESASAKRRSRARKRSSSYTADPCTPPKDGQTPAMAADSVFSATANDDSNELDRMLIAGEDNYLNPQQENTPDNVPRKSYSDELLCFITCFTLRLELPYMAIWLDWARWWFPEVNTSLHPKESSPIPIV